MREKMWFVYEYMLKKSRRDEILRLRSEEEETRRNIENGKTTTILRI
jgi:hypothetical protein